MSGIDLYSTNNKIYEDEVSLYLARKIYGDRMKCCLKAIKDGKQCEYADELDHKYSGAVDGALDEVKSVCETLCMSPVLINSYNVTPLWKRQFNQSGYMKYHLENWYINVIRLEDMLLVLINAVYQLGIKKELLGYEIVSTNTNLPTNVIRNLKALHKATKPIRAARIMLIHHQTLFEKDLHDIRGDETMVKILKENPPVEVDKELEQSIKITSFWTKKFKAPRYRLKKRDFMLESNHALLEHTSLMLQDMESIFESAFDKLLNDRSYEHK
jgi:hypothetical protein